MDLEIGKKYKLRRIKDLCCNYIYTPERTDYIRIKNGEGLINHNMDSYMGKNVIVRSISAWGSTRYLIEGCDHSNFHRLLFEDSLGYTIKGDYYD